MQDELEQFKGGKVSGYYLERWCQDCQTTTVFMVTISGNKTRVITTTTCQKCKKSEGKIV